MTGGNESTGQFVMFGRDFRAFAQFLVRAGIDSMSVNPDSVVTVIDHVTQAEQAISEPA